MSGRQTRTEAGRFGYRDRRNLAHVGIRSTKNRSTWPHIATADDCTDLEDIFGIGDLIYEKLGQA